MRLFRCDRQGCGTMGRPALFIIVKYGERYGGQKKHYCSPWCMVVQESKDAEPKENEEVG